MDKPKAGDPVGTAPGTDLRGSAGSYRLLRRLGAGGMGNVYLARSDRGRTVAVKLVRRELAEQEEFRARFRHEVEVARRVGGHWTAPVLDADTEADIPWVATGYVAGPTLHTVVSQDHGALPERSVRVLAAGLAHALQDIHEAGLIHRDLKPSNVLVTIDGPRVIDFGIARAMETLTGAWLTRTGALVGSPGFMSPEQVRGDRITPACDVFCLGSVLTYAATGAFPFGTVDSGVHALMFRIAQQEPELGGMPEELAALVRDCLRKDPAARPTPAQILERIGAEDTVSDGRSREPWLPGSLVAQLGRHAVRLLDAEDPQDAVKAALPGPRTGDSGAPQDPVDLTKRLPDPQVAPEHAAAADAAPAPGAPAVPDRLPVQAAGPGHTPAPGAQPAYGHPQQHPQPPVHGDPQNAGGWTGTPAPGPVPPYGSVPYGAVPYGDLEPQSQRGNRRSTAVLVAVALVVALGAGGSVYALMRGDGHGTKGAAGPSHTAGAPTAQHPTTPAPSASKSASSGSPSPAAGTVPTAYLGTWNAAIDNAGGHSTRQLVVQQGKVGDTVLSLTADGPPGSGTYHCVFQAKLAEKPTAGSPLEIGPSTVTVGRPTSSCTPGQATELTILPDGRLKRLNTSTGESLTYTKGD
jgi:serine/threonine protein kinase